MRFIETARWDSIKGVSDDADYTYDEIIKIRRNIRMKNKIFAVLTAAVAGVMSFAPVMTAQAYEAPCYKCGEYSIVAEVVDYREIQVTDPGKPEPCRHGHSLAADFLVQREALVRYYCGDCELHWEDWEKAGGYWYCTFDNEKYPL